MSNYLIESSICLAAFYSFYWIVLHREKLLNINRYYLLGSVIVSLIVPLLNIKTRWSLFQTAEPIQTIATVGGEQITQTQSTPIITLETLYFTGLAIALTVLIVKLVLLKRKLGSSFSLKNQHIDVVEIEGHEAFSFYNTIYIGKELSQDQYLKEQIIAHEYAHIDGKHTLDTLFFELLKCFYWFNPFSYFYSQSAQLQHEFIADQFVLKKSETKVYERSLLQLALLKISPGLVASFNQHPIQKRLKMMKTINSNIMKRLKPLFALPVLGALVFALACTDEVNPESNEIVFEETEIPVDLKPRIDSIYVERIAFTLQGKLDSFLIQKDVIGTRVTSTNVTLLPVIKEDGKDKYVLRLDGANGVSQEIEGHKIPFIEKELETPVVQSVTNIKKSNQD